MQNSFSFYYAFVSSKTDRGLCTPTTSINHTFCYECRNSLEQKFTLEFSNISNRLGGLSQLRLQPSLVKHVHAFLLRNALAGYSTIASHGELSTGRDLMTILKENEQI